MINVVCVKWGDKFNSSHTKRLQKMVSKYLTVPYTFTCLTDNPEDLDCNIIDITEYELDGVWNKLILFKEGLFDGTCLYLDQDVVIQNNIDHLLNYLSDNLTMIKSFWKDESYISDGNFSRPKDRFDMNFNSSVMLWKANTLSCIWEHFISDPEWFMLNYMGIDRFLFHEKFKLDHFPKGEIYSRLFGYGNAEGESGPIVEDNQFKLFYKPEYAICIFNAYGKKKNGPTGIHLDDNDYQGFEQYWS